MRWVIAGALGMLGTDLARVVEQAGHEVRRVDRVEMDITDADEVAATIAGCDVLVNCAAWTAVDAAEAAEPDAFWVNAVGPATLARAAASLGIRMVQVSTDYVFDGAATTPYTEDAPMRPRSAYGRTKAAGEWAVKASGGDHLVVRTAWLYGAHGSCFPRTVLRVLQERGSIDVVDDQVGQPTWTVDLAGLILALVEAGVPAGTYHGTSGGQTTWHGFAREVAVAAGFPPESVVRTTSEDFVRPAARPSYSVLGHAASTAAAVEPIGPWWERWRAAAPHVLELDAE